MMSEETKAVLRAILSSAVGLAAELLTMEGQDEAARILHLAMPSLVEKLLGEVIDESVEIKVGPDATATGVVDFGD